MFNSFLDGLFSELLSTCIELDGILYVPLDEILSSLGAWFTLHIFIWVPLFVVLWKFYDLILVVLGRLFRMIVHRIQLCKGE